MYAHVHIMYVCACTHVCMYSVVHVHGTVCTVCVTVRTAVAHGVSVALVRRTTGWSHVPSSCISQHVTVHVVVLCTYTWYTHSTCTCSTYTYTCMYMYTYGFHDKGVFEKRVISEKVKLTFFKKSLF